MRRFRLLLPMSALLCFASSAFADATVFLGTAATPSHRTARGFALGAGLLIVGFEFEYTDAVPDELAGAPALRMGMGNVLLQTPTAILGLQPYLTTGGGVYREWTATHAETHFGVNNGGGVKISLAGPVRARIDYRVFSLRGSPLHTTVQRVYVGLNLKF
jgi:hypothetical protein